jgi:hypothetical protein
MVIKKFKCNTCKIAMPPFMFLDVKKDELSCRLCDEVVTLKEELSSQKELVRDLTDRVKELEERVKPQNAHRSGEEGGPSILREGAGYKEVKNGARRIKEVKLVHPLKLTNRYSPLPGLQENGNCKIKIIGDSMIRDQLTDFCGRDAKN